MRGRLTTAATVYDFVPMRSDQLKTKVKAALLRPAYFFNTNFAYTGRLQIGLSRGALNASMRHVDPERPDTWELSAFSQNGEDGIIEHLLSLVRDPNRYFVEIGASDGLENNSSFLAFAQKYDGIMIEGDRFKSGNAKRFLQSLNWSVKYLNLFVEPANVDVILREAAYQDPDFFSLDIDSNDFFVMEMLLKQGLRPKVVCVEYNSAFGPVAKRSINYTPGIHYETFHESQLYYGVSVAGWRASLERFGYRFVTVERHGVNAFFVDESAVDLPHTIRGRDFAENTAQLRRHNTGWEGQFAKIAHLGYFDIP